MKPSFLFIETYYPAFLDYFYSKNKDIIDKNYDEQKAVLMSECFGTSNFCCLNLVKLGYKADNIIANNEILQKKWAEEYQIAFNNSANFHPLRQFSFLRNFIQKKPQFYYWIKEIINRKSWVYQILLAQIKKYQPDVLYILDIGFFSPSFLKAVKKHTKIIVGQIACPLPPDENFRFYNLIISSLPHYIEKFRNMGLKSEFLKFGFEVGVLNNLKKTLNQYNIAHIGGYGPIHEERNKILERLAHEVDIKFWGYGTNFLEKNSLILRNYMGESWGINRYNIFYNSKIVVTKHITSVAQNFANNETLYEATGTGTMLLTDYKDNLNEIFEIGKKVETYRDTKELIEKVDYYLNHEEERKKIAKAGQKRTLKEHTYETRMKELLNILKKYL